MRERVPTLLYIAAALALCSASITAVQHVRGAGDEQRRSAERAAEEAKQAAVCAAEEALRESQLAQEKLEAITRELETIDAALERAVEALGHATTEQERRERREELLNLQRQQLDRARRPCAHDRSHCRYGAIAGAR